MSHQPSCRPAVRTSSLAVVSLVFGLLCWCVLPFLGAIVAVVCGHMARSEVRNSPPDARVEGDGMAIAGLVLGYAQLALCLLGVALAIAALIFGVAFLNWF